ncbi:MAG: reverse transcriptase family protein, partial [Bacteroidota bacterium]
MLPILPPEFPPVTDEKLCESKVTASLISKLITELDSTKATGPDGIPVVVLKHLNPELSPILAKLFNRCLKEKCFPSVWKTSAVCPVFKNAGEKSNPAQYRPISLLSVISKLFESVINKRILDHLNRNNLLSDVQYGFRSARSTADVLTVITHRISEAMAMGNHSRVIALDISKAFDKVWHKGLLLKLSSYGISGKVLAVIKSFLSGRSLRVVVNGQSSHAHSINAGVPQGSILGPTLFLLFINDLPKHIINSLVDIYADDTTLYRCTSTDVDDVKAASDLSSDLEQIVQWGKDWFVTFNASKTKLVTFHYKIERGVIFLVMK